MAMNLSRSTPRQPRRSLIGDALLRRRPEVWVPQQASDDGAVSRQSIAEMSGIRSKVSPDPWCKSPESRFGLDSLEASLCLQLLAASLPRLCLPSPPKSALRPILYSIISCDIAMCTRTAYDDGIK